MDQVQKALSLEVKLAALLAEALVETLVARVRQAQPLQLVVFLLQASSQQDAKDPATLPLRQKLREKLLRAKALVSLEGREPQKEQQAPGAEQAERAQPAALACCARMAIWRALEKPALRKLLHPAAGLA